MAAMPEYLLIGGPCDQIRVEWWIIRALVVATSPKKK
jgi:hypothetical protein